MGVDNVATIPLSCEVITHSIISPFLISLKPPANSSVPPKGFCPEGKIPRRHSRLVACAYIKESTLSWNIQSVYQRKTRFVGTGAAWNRWVMMTFLLFAPASKRWLGWRKTENPEGTAKVDFVTFIVQSYFDTLLRYVLSVTFCGAAVLKVINEKTLVKRRWSYKAPTTVYIYKYPWRVCQTRVHKSLIGNNLQDTLSLP